MTTIKRQLIVFWFLLAGFGIPGAALAAGSCSCSDPKGFQGNCSSASNQSACHDSSKFCYCIKYFDADDTAFDQSVYSGEIQGELAENEADPGDPYALEAFLTSTPSDGAQSLMTIADKPKVPRTVKCPCIWEVSCAACTVPSGHTVVTDCPAKAAQCGNFFCTTAPPGHEDDQDEWQVTACAAA